MFSTVHKIDVMEANEYRWEEPQFEKGKNSGIMADK